MRRTCHELHRKKDGSGHFSQDSGIQTIPEEISSNQLKNGMLRNVMKDLVSLLNELNSEYNDMVIIKVCCCV